MDPHLHLITRDPAFVPDAAHVERFKSFLLEEGVLALNETGQLETGPELGKLIEQTGPFELRGKGQLQARVPVRLSVHREPEYFFPAASNFGARCPKCSEALALKAWQRAMERWEKSGKKNRLVLCKACEKRVDLNDLVYASSRGFSRFSLDIVGLHTANCALQWTYLEVLEDKLGSALSVVLDQVDRARETEPPGHGKPKLSKPKLSKARKAKGKRKKR